MGQSEIISLMKGIEHPSLKLFKKVKHIGRGGFGHVWKVLFSKGDYYLAMKQLSKIEILKKHFIANIFSERDILNIIYNVHIVNLYATFQDENYLYMIMDYLEGGDLRKRMKEKTFNLKEIKFIAACIIIGLEYIHKKGIIHRDIKPENLIFDDKGYLRISDFGIAIRNDKINIIEKNNDKSGTPGYMAPERIINNIDISYSYSSDYFSLGVILYELIVLKKPFRRNNDKIGRFHYNSYEEIILEIFNNEKINLTPAYVKTYRNTDNINKNEIKMNNEELSNLCDLINKLLIYEQEKRLGYNNIEDIKNHPFFGESFEWKKIYHRSYNSPFIKYESHFNKKNENKKNDIDDITKFDKNNYVSNEEKEFIQKKFNNFTLIHKITKDDFNYFYLNENIPKNRNDSYNINKYRDSIKKNIKNVFTSISKQNIKFLSQLQNEKKNNNNIVNLKYKIRPNQLFKENTNLLINNVKIKKIILANNKINNSNSIIKNEKSPKQLKLPMEIIEENFMNKYFNKTNINFSKIKNFKNNINKNKFNFFPLIISERDNRKTFEKPSSAIVNKKKYNSIENYKIDKRILFEKYSFHINFYKHLINKHEKNDKKKSNEIFLTDSNNNIYNSLKTSRLNNEKSTLLKNNGDIIINENKYRDKIIQINNNNIDRAIKEIFMKK